MGAIRAVTIISGVDANDREQTLVGLAVQTLRFDPSSFVVALDTSVNPPRVVITGNAELGDRVTALEDMIDVASTADTIAKRDASAQLAAAAFIGNAFKASTSGDPAVAVDVIGGFPAVGFCGAAPVNQQPIDTLAADTDRINDIQAGLIALGLFYAV